MDRTAALSSSPARRNRVDPHGDLHAVSSRGLFTGNRGCLVDDDGTLARHHVGNLWITCVTSFKDWRSPLDQPHHWTPVFFLDDAVALAAGHRPCGLCRRDDYATYRAAIARSDGRKRPPSATELNDRLATERLRPGRGLDRARDRIVWRADIGTIPDGAVVLDPGGFPYLVLADRIHRFGFDGWHAAAPRPSRGHIDVLTPPTSIAALNHGYTPTLHPTATGDAPPSA